jgi:hypothetical protein
MATESKDPAGPPTTAASKRPGCDLTVVVLVLWLHFYWRFLSNNSLDILVDRWLALKVMK